ncbi:MAG: hypothetical protein ABFD96_00020, partial [Armatimonadia bacterium]
MSRSELLRLSMLVLLMVLLVMGVAAAGTPPVTIDDPVIPLNPGMINTRAMDEYFRLNSAADADKKSLEELLGNTPADPMWVRKLLSILTNTDFEAPPMSPAELTHEECRAYLLDKDVSIKIGYAPAGLNLGADKKKTTLILEWSRYRRYQVPYKITVPTGADGFCRFRYGVAARMVMHTTKEGVEFGVTGGCLGLGVKASVKEVKCDYQIIGFGSADASRALPALVDLSDAQGV